MHNMCEMIGCPIMGLTRSSPTSLTAILNLMWSLVAKILELMVDRARVRVDVRWTMGPDSKPYDLHRRALTIDVTNPVDRSIPVEDVFLKSGSSTRELTLFLRGADPTPPCTIPALDQHQYAVPLYNIVKVLLDTDHSGWTTFRVSVRHATGREDQSSWLSLDLEPLRTWLWVLDQTILAEHESLERVQPVGSGHLTGRVVGRALPSNTQE